MNRTHRFFSVVLDAGHNIACSARKTTVLITATLRTSITGVKAGHIMFLNVLGGKLSIERALMSHLFARAGPLMPPGWDQHNTHIPIMMQVLWKLNNVKIRVFVHYNTRNIYKRSLVG